MRTITLELPDSLIQRIDRAAQTENLTRSDFICALLENALGEDEKRAESCWELSKDLAGCVRWMPQDLATNPKYMEGFGR
jgi:metal-responsive CopG/Arc/MetJ family transcriptional regulator